MLVTVTLQIKPPFFLSLLTVVKKRLHALLLWQKFVQWKIDISALHSDCKMLIRLCLNKLVLSFENKHHEIMRDPSFKIDTIAAVGINSYFICIQPTILNQCSVAHWWHSTEWHLVGRGGAVEEVLLPNRLQLKFL